jgi:hypothetical protein
MQAEMDSQTRRDLTQRSAPRSTPAIIDLTLIGYHPRLLFALCSTYTTNRKRFYRYFLSYEYSVQAKVYPYKSGWTPISLLNRVFHISVFGRNLGRNLMPDLFSSCNPNTSQLRSFVSYRGADHDLTRSFMPNFMTQLLPSDFHRPSPLPGTPGEKV